MKREKMTEEQLAEQVVGWLTAEGWEVYQEVESRGYRIDIVAKRGPVIWAIECKLAFGFPVIEQAHRHIGRAHYVSIAVPHDTGRSTFGYEVLQMFGIGILRVHTPGTYYRAEEPYEEILPAFFRKPKLVKLHEEQKSYAKAGTNQGGYWTGFKSTKQRLIAHVEKFPGQPLKEILATTKHHYCRDSTAYSCMAKLIGTTAIPELELKKIEGKLCVFPKENNVGQ